MKTFPQIQKECKEWQIRNFGKQTPEAMVLGFIEELGELAHSELKMYQGIRGTREQHIEGAKDAVGDMTIYLFQYLSMHDVEAIAPSDYQDDPPLTVFCAIQDILECATILFSSPHKDNYYILGDAIQAYCEARGFNYVEVVNQTWEKVSKRDWVNNKLDGGDNG